LGARGLAGLASQIITRTREILRAGELFREWRELRERKRDETQTAPSDKPKSVETDAPEPEKRRDGAASQKAGESLRELGAAARDAAKELRGLARDNEPKAGDGPHPKLAAPEPPAHPGPPTPPGSASGDQPPLLQPPGTAAGDKAKQPEPESPPGEQPTKVVPMPQPPGSAAKEMPQNRGILTATGPVHRERDRLVDRFPQFRRLAPRKSRHVHHSSPTAPAVHTVPPPVQVSPAVKPGVAGARSGVAQGAKAAIRGAAGAGVRAATAVAGTAARGMMAMANAGAAGASALAGLAAAAGPVGIALGVLVAGAGAAGLAAKKFADMAEREAERLKSFSVDLATSQALADVRRQLADLRRAREVGPELARFQTTRSRFEDRLADLGTQVIEILTGLANRFEPAIEGFGRLLAVVTAFLDFFGPLVEKGVDEIFKITPIVEIVTKIFNLLVKLAELIPGAKALIQRFLEEERSDPFADPMLHGFFALGGPDARWPRMPEVPPRPMLP
jgi:hypothetical protein